LLSFFECFLFFSSQTCFELVCPASWGSQGFAWRHIYKRVFPPWRSGSCWPLAGVFPNDCPAVGLTWHINAFAVPEVVPRSPGVRGPHFFSVVLVPLKPAPSKELDFCWIGGSILLVVCFWGFPTSAFPPVRIQIRTRPLLLMSLLGTSFTAPVSFAAARKPVLQLAPPTPSDHRVLSTLFLTSCESRARHSGFHSQGAQRGFRFPVGGCLFCGVSIFGVVIKEVGCRSSDVLFRHFLSLAVAFCPPTFFSSIFP